MGKTELSLEEAVQMFSEVMTAMREEGHTGSEWMDAMRAFYADHRIKGADPDDDGDALMPEAGADRALTFDAFVDMRGMRDGDYSHETAQRVVVSFNRQVTIEPEFAEKNDEDGNDDSCSGEAIMTNMRLELCYGEVKKGEKVESHSAFVDSPDSFDSAVEELLAVPYIAACLAKQPERVVTVVN